jgi:predicted glutamine amidotransferase
MMDKFREECGVFGVYGHPEAANLTYLGLYALQHRGQESVGIATSDGKRLEIHKAVGYVADSFDESTFTRLAGMSAVGHVRYSTAGQSGIKNAQPLLIDCAHGEIAIAHNGNLVNAQELRDMLVSAGSIFQTTSDTEVLLHLFARSTAPTVEQALIESVSQAQGAFSLVLLTKDRLIAVRDPHGFRPLTLGRLGDAFVVSSETCALDLIDATWVRDVEPGEMLVIGPDGERSWHPFPPAPSAHCVFEHVYFARPDSNVFGLCGDRLFGGVGPTAQDGPDPQSLRGPNVHRAASVDSPLWRAGQAQSGAQHSDGQARRAGRRLHRARDDQPEDCEDGTGRRCHRSPHAGQLPAHDFAVLLRRRHAQARGPDRGHALDRGNPTVHRCRLAGISVGDRTAPGRRTEPVELLHVVLYRPVSRGLSAQ